MPQSFDISIKPSILDRERNLIINQEFIQFDDTELKDAKPTNIPKSGITGFKYGVKPIRGYMFYIGTTFCIDVCGTAEQIIKLRLKSLYGIRRKELAAKYSQIIDALYDNYFDETIWNCLNKFENGEEFEIAATIFKSNGLIFEKAGKLIEWEDLGTKAYSSYYTLFSKRQPNHYYAYEYVNDWNVGILYGATQQILKSKNLTNA